MGEKNFSKWGEEDSEDSENSEFSEDSEDSEYSEYSEFSEYSDYSDYSEYSEYSEFGAIASLSDKWQVFRSVGVWECRSVDNTPPLELYTGSSLLSPGGACGGLPDSGGLEDFLIDA